MRERVKKSVSLYYEIYMIGLFLVSCAPSLSFIINRNNIFIKYYPLLGIILLILNIYAGNKIWKKDSMIFFGCFMISFIATTISNLKYSYNQNIKQIFWIMLLVVIIYTYDTCFKTRGDYLESVYRICNVIIVYCLILNIASVILLFCNIFLRKIDGSAVMGYYYAYGRHYGATTSLLDNSRFAVVCLFLPLFQSTIKKISKPWRVIYIINNVLSIVFIWGAVSRGTYLILAVMLFVIVFAKKFLNDYQAASSLIRFGKSFLTALMGSGVFVVFFAIIGGRIVSYIPVIGGYFVKKFTIEDYNGWFITNSQNSEMVARNLLDTGTLKINLGGASVASKLIKNDWLFGMGVGNENYYKELAGYVNNTHIGSFPLIDVLRISGVIGTVLLLSGCMNIFIKAILRLWKDKYTVECQRIVLMAAITGGIFVYTSIMFTFTTTTFVFWMFFSCLERLIRSSEMIKETE